MRAVQITRFGGPEVLDVVDLPGPVPGDGQQSYQLCDTPLAELGGAFGDDVGLLAARAHPEDRPRPPEAGPWVEPADLRVADRRLPGSRWGISPGSRC
jgi:hypothetical protein